MAVLLFFVVAAPSPAQAQPPVTITTVAAPVNILSLSDVDFRNATTPKWLFTITISAVDTVTVALRISLRATLANGEVLDNVIDMRTAYLTVNRTKTITNLDLRDRNILPDNGYQVDPDKKRRLEEIALSAGTVPAGVYRFIVEIVGSAEPPESFDIIISNPSSVELMTPFDGDEFVNQFPLFQWRGDAPRWRIGVYEFTQGQSSLEEAVSGVPHFTMIVDGQSIQYPSSGVRALEDNHKYAWFVEGLVGVSGGGTQAGMRSEIRSFTVSGRGAAGGSWLDQVEQSLGARYKGLFDQIRVEGLTPTGTIRLNGTTITTAELLRVLNQIRSNPDAASALLE